MRAVLDCLKLYFITCFRQLALKALNERLSRVPAAQPWPLVDEDANVATSSSSFLHAQSAVTSSIPVVGSSSALNVDVNSFSSQNSDHSDAPS